MSNESLQKEAAALLSKALGVEVDWVLSTLEIPTDRKMGDLALPCFKLAKEKRMAPAQIAKEAAEALPAEMPLGVEKIEAVGPYLNVFIDPEYQTRRLLGEILEKREHFGSSDIGKGKKVILDFSPP
ncbi:MAG: arginine--tRNA ligase, partial [Candidatus Omnitrophica bacterium]|nr:arginine--tRNA ligase [Candidatus Omnitrophota bacterium]